MEIMARTRYAGAVALIVLGRVCCVFTQPGFVSIDCGGERNQTDNDTNIKWANDDNYIQGGYSARLNDSSLPFYLQSRRVFPSPLMKSCYVLPITPNVPFLLRVYFVGGNYNNQLPNFNYTIETQDMLSLRNPTNQTKPPVSSEKILVSGGETMYICLIRTSPYVDPFISSIELRPLRQGMYKPVNPGLMLHGIVRYNIGAQKTVRYPLDQFDRLWFPYSIDGAEIVSLGEPISTNKAQDLPPPAVMQMAAVTDVDRMDIRINRIEESLLLLYFAEIQQLNASESRIFYINIDNEPKSPNVHLVRNLSAIELRFITEPQISSFTVFKASKYNRGPILNAFELYQRVPTISLTYLQDVQALVAVKKRFNISYWTSDPCFALPWKGIQCSNTPRIVRVLHIDLSRKNLTGSIPSSLANLTALISIALNNNQLTGGLPNLSNLTQLERLNLQNNSLSGEVPEWLSQLHNLKELYIENNNFSGVISQQLIDQPSLKIRHGGNLYLCMNKAECVRSNATSHSESNGRKVKLIAGVIAGGITIIVLLMFVGTIVWQKKIRGKKNVNADSRDSTSRSTESIYVRGQDFSMVLVPNSTKSRSFTLDDMLTATENFTHKIGQGGFGSVFLGKLQEGKQIAVKVLSSFSKQGAVEFLNEIDLLSRVHHKNLVSLLGYCNESRELMLAYDYMTRGSLKDHLYGSNAGHYPKLDWKTRLQIAFGAAQGLEYLHVGCTPKIIHRDVKTANILLDSNLTGKLADFGLSRVTMDGEASHVTTTVKGTAGYLDPEYFSTQMLTEKSDVYSFGVVLLEIICGRRPIDVKLCEEEINLIRWVTPFVKADDDPCKISEIVDKRLQPTDYDIKSVIHVAKLAIRCTGSDPSARPSVGEVVAEIKVAIKYDSENNATTVDDVSENISTEYGDQISSQVSISDSSGPKEIGGSENSSIFTRE